MGEEKLCDIAQAAFYDLTVKKATEAFRTYYFREHKAGRIRSFADFGARLGVDGSTANRYFNGRIRKTDFRRMDDYLRRIGTNLRDVLPHDTEVRNTIMEATLATMLEARQICYAEKEGFLPLTQERADEICRIVDANPMSADAKEDPTLWKRWLCKAADYIERSWTRRVGRPPQSALITKVDSSAWATALLSGDWQVAKSYLPWQLLALVYVSLEMLGRIAEVVHKGVLLSTDIDSETVPTTTIYLKSDADRMLRYFRLTVLADRPLWKDPDLCDLHPVLLPHRPRFEIIERFGCELMEGTVFPEASAPDFARPPTLRKIEWNYVDRAIVFKFQMAFAPEFLESIRAEHSSNAPRYLAAGLRRYTTEVWSGATETTRAIAESSTGTTPRQCRINCFVADHDDDGVTLNFVVPVKGSATWSSLENLTKDLHGSHLRAVEQAVDLVQLLVSMDWLEAMRRGVHKGIYLWNYLSDLYTTEVQSDIAFRANFCAHEWGRDTVGQTELLAAFLPSKYADAWDSDVGAILKKVGLVYEDLADQLRILSSSQHANGLHGQTTYQPEATNDAKRPASTAKDIKPLDERAKEILHRAALFSIELGHRQTHSLHVVYELLRCRELRNLLEPCASDIGQLKLEMQRALAEHDVAWPWQEFLDTFAELLQDEYWAFGETTQVFLKSDSDGNTAYRDRLVPVHHCLADDQELCKLSPVLLPQERSGETINEFATDLFEATVLPAADAPSFADPVVSHEYVVVYTCRLILAPKALEELRSYPSSNGPRIAAASLHRYADEMSFEATETITRLAQGSARSFSPVVKGFVEACHDEDVTVNIVLPVRETATWGEMQALTRQFQQCHFRADREAVELIELLHSEDWHGAKLGERLRGGNFWDYLSDLHTVKVQSTIESRADSFAEMWGRESIGQLELLAAFLPSKLAEGRDTSIDAILINAGLAYEDLDADFQAAAMHARKVDQELNPRKQPAQHHGSRLDSSFALGRKRAKPLDREAKEILQRAAVLSTELGHRRTDSIHVLYELLRFPWLVPGAVHPRMSRSPGLGIELQRALAEHGIGWPWPIFSEVFSRFLHPRYWDSCSDGL